MVLRLFLIVVFAGEKIIIMSEMCVNIF